METLPMTRVLLQTSSPFRPEDETLPPEVKSQVQLHRLLTLMGTVLVPAFGLLYATANPLAEDPAWARLGVTGLFVGLFVASYWIEEIRRNYVWWLRGLLYVLVGWTILLTSINHFAGDYVAGLLLVYAALIVVVGIGARSLRPVLWFAGAGLLATALSVLFAMAPYTSPLVLLASMATVALVESIAIHAYLSTQEQLREREERLRGLTNSVPGVIFQFMARPDGTYRNTFVGDHAETLLGIPPHSDDFFKRVLGRVPPARREELVEAIDRAVEDQKVWRFEIPFEHPDGERRWLLGTSTPLHRGDELVFNGVIFDITDRKRAEQAVEGREQKTEALYTATEHLVTASSAEEVASRLEEIVRTTFEYPLNSVHFAREGTLVPVAVSQRGPGERPEVPAPDLDGQSLRARVYRSGKTIVASDLAEFERDLDYGALQSGACVPIETYGVLSMASPEANGIDPFDVQLGEILAAHAEAVLDRIVREKELVAAKEEAEEVSQLKSAMLANMSHEIRTPLTAVTGFAGLLKERLEGEPATFSEKILQSGHRLLNTLDSVVKISTLEAGTYELDRERMSLRPLIEEAAERLRPRAEAKSLTLETDLPEGRLQGAWHEGALNRIVENLVENAIKFTPEGGSVEVRAWEEDGEAVLEVEDSGIGVSRDALPEIFQAFKQESEGLNREYEGSGLGLSIAYRLIETLGGEIEVETEKGEGTCFMVRLPKTGRRPPV